MFGTIRRHQKWLVPVTFITVISFTVFFKPMGGTGNGRGGDADLGSVSGEPITMQDYRQAHAEAFLQYFLNHGEWPDKDTSAKSYGFDERRDTYLRLFYTSKFKEYNIHVSPDAVGRMAAQIFRSLGRNNTPMDPAQFEKDILATHGFNMADFRRFLENEIALRELINLVGLSGQFITTEEATSLFQLELQEVSTEAVFFSPSNFLASVNVSPEELGRFYTNQLPRYRLPDRVQVGYVKFNLTNYLPAADAQIAKLTNFDAEVDALYLQRGGTNYYTDARSPADAKARIKEEHRRRFAMYFARTNATGFAEELMTNTPVQPANLEMQAARYGMIAGVTAPFDNQHGPADLNVPAAFAHAAFKLTTDEPVGGPLAADDGMYIVLLRKQLPSENPPEASIHDQVVADLKYEEAARLAFYAGTNFAVNVSAGLAQGKTFSAIAAEAGRSVVKIPPFSLSSRSLPEVENHISLARLQEVAMSLPTGSASRYVQSEDGGGLVLHVLARLPGDVTKLRTDFPGFLARVRQTRQGEAFNAWLGREADRALHDTPLLREHQAQAQR